MSIVKEMQELWFGLGLIFGVIWVVFNVGYFVIDYPIHSDCNSLKDGWQNLCNNWYQTFYNIETMMGLIVSVSWILYIIARCEYVPPVIIKNRSAV